jgi:hypothetical protein
MVIYIFDTSHFYMGDPMFVRVANGVLRCHVGLKFSQFFKYWAPCWASKNFCGQDGAQILKIWEYLDSRWGMPQSGS